MMYVSLSGVLLRAAELRGGPEYSLRQLYQHLQELHARHMHGEDGTKLLNEFFDVYVDLDAPSGLEVKN